MAKPKPGRRVPRQQGTPPDAASATSRGSRRRIAWGALAIVALLATAALLVTCWTAPAGREAPASPAQPPLATFVGAQACGGCHARQLADWAGSQHAKAMQHATEQTVLGDFDDARFDYHGVVSTFFRRDGKFFVQTDGADGKLADFQVLYTFGVYPLQQYLVGFPDGRLQALSIAWDARPKAEGGERWYHLYPEPRVSAKDPLHWTGLDQNWNWMCADCHTTNLRRNYDVARDTYHTEWSEMNVACEACHGPGSRHVDWARRPPASRGPAPGLVVALDERRGVSWQPVAATGNAVRSTPLGSQRELTTCAQCHSRRAPMAEGMRHDGRFLDTHEIALLTEAYFPDGQQRDEDYIVGSFLQSRMHAQGVTCSDCHNPHSGALRAPGNAVCAQCHAPAKYDAPAHTLHAAGSAGAQCADCHMPTRTYMGVDARHDHSIRIPRPDLSQALGTPNACTGCHQDRSPDWAAQAIARRFGPDRKGFQQFGAAFHHARSGAPGAAAELVALVGNAGEPAIVRATALAELTPYLDPQVLDAVATGLRDGDPMVRGAALDTLGMAPAAERLRLGLGLLEDPARLVRLKAARVLAVATPGDMDAARWTKLQSAFDDYVASQRANAERPEAHVNLGLFYADRGDVALAERSYADALARRRDFAPAYVNLADLYRGVGRDEEAGKALEGGLRAVPGHADLAHALGLLRIRQRRLADAIPLLTQAAAAAPSNVRYAYVLGVALHELGRRGEAITVLEEALGRFPNDLSLLDALSAYSTEAGDAKAADRYARRRDTLRAAAPGG